MGAFAAILTAVIVTGENEMGAAIATVKQFPQPTMKVCTERALELSELLEKKGVMYVVRCAEKGKPI